MQLKVWTHYNSCVQVAVQQDGSQCIAGCVLGACGFISTSMLLLLHLLLF